ncbi:MAG: AAA family ATPase, partial [Candidatus Cloacimonetes bacterium]|nr:AAA family ATPase [Candidatus Cloacimonadota bacterium]
MKVIDTSHSSFESLISQHKLYVDKTSFIYKLITGPDMVFFSRPRRFGKSLTVSTL